jgi:hypothetical protein
MEPVFWAPFLASLRAAGVTATGVAVIRRFEDWALRERPISRALQPASSSQYVPSHPAEGPGLERMMSLRPEASMRPRR